MKKIRPNLKVSVITVLIAVAIILFVVLALYHSKEDILLTPDVAPDTTEKYAETIPNDHDSPVKDEAGGGSVSLAYSNEVTIDLSDMLASLYFANPGKSNKSIVLQIIIQEQVVIQSDLLPPSYQVKQLAIQPSAANKLSPGGYHGTFRVLYYDINTGEKSVVDTKIPIYITVRK